MIVLSPAAAEHAWTAWLARSDAAICGTFTISPPRLGDPPRWVRVEHRGDYGATVTAFWDHAFTTARARYPPRPPRPRRTLSALIRAAERYMDYPDGWIVSQR